MSKRLRSQLPCEDSNGRNFEVAHDLQENVPATLTESCIAFISNNLHFVDSFLDFPDIIAEKIFKAARDNNIFTNENKTLSASLRCFTEAYGASVLESLCLAGKHLILNKYFDTLCLFDNLTKLDISNCGLGHDHDMLYQLSTVQSLQTLNVRGNSLKDAGIRKFTAPLRMFKQTLQDLRHCDLSDNGLTDQCLRYLLCLPRLEIINLSRNKITSYTSLKSNCLYLAANVTDLCEEVFGIGTVGWAAPVVEDWCRQDSREQLKTAAEQKPRNSFYSKAKVCTSRASAKQSVSVYTDVLVSSKVYPQLVKDKHFSNQSTESKSKHPLKHVKPPLQDDCEDNYLMTLYGGFKSSNNQIRSLSDVFV